MFWASSGRKDAPKLHSIDISYIITILLNSIKPATTTSPVGQIAPTGKQYLTVGEVVLPNSNATHKSIRQFKDLLQTASLLGRNLNNKQIKKQCFFDVGLKILIIGFNKQLKREWSRLIPAIKSLCTKSNISSNLLLFIDFLVSYKTPIYLILRPFLLHYV
jgi:hypothetical protein